jgi:hypothetical protein
MVMTDTELVDCRKNPTKRAAGLIPADSGYLSFALRTAVVLLASAVPALAAPTEPPPKPPESITAADHPWDDGTKIDVTFSVSPDDGQHMRPPRVARYVVERAGEPNGRFEAVGSPLVPNAADYSNGRMETTIDKCRPGEPYYFRVRAVAADGTRSAPAETAVPAVATRQWFDGDRIWLAVIMAALCGAIIFFIERARRGHPVKVRRIAGLEAIEEAVGRATEMGRSCLFVPGIQDLNEIQTIAGLNILSRVAKVAAEYDAKVEVPTARSLVMTAARETVQAAFLAAGRPDSYSEDLIYYVTDEQFGYVAFLTGKMVREKPAACFYLGAFYAESLMLAETGNSIGAIQIAGTAEPAQLPFFVAACDYTLIGEEFFAASAYLSGDPDQLGSLQGQDLGKLVVGTLLVVGSLLATAAVMAKWWSAPNMAADLQTAVDYLRNTVLK